MNLRRFPDTSGHSKVPMEPFSGVDLSTAERIAWGLLSFIALIVYLRWEGPWEDQKKDEPPKVSEHDC
jgi:hypothetical protein